jgi:hypothetical protein
VSGRRDKGGGAEVDPKRLEYEGGAERLVYRAEERGKSLLSAAIGRALGAIARAGAHEGRRVREVIVRFGDRDAAEHNATPLKFLGVGSAWSGGRVESEARFETGDDFGIAPEHRGRRDD